MRDPSSGWIQVSAAEFTLLWASLELPNMPHELGLHELGRTRARRDELHEYASTTLSTRGLGTVGQPAADLTALLRTLGERRITVDIWAEGHGPPLRAVAGAAGRDASGAARVGDEIRIGPLTPPRLVSALLEAVAPLPAGPGRPVNVAAADYEAACVEGDRDGVTGFLDALRDAGLSQPDASTLARALTGRYGGGRLGASARDRSGRMARASSPINWVDTAEGRYVLRRNGAWITVTPVDPARFAAMAEDMLADARRD